MKRTTKTTATGWLWLCFGLGLCAACEDEPVCVGGTGEGGDCASDGDAGADGDADADADADADGDADRYAAIAASYEAERVASGTPGLAVAIIENGELAWSQEFGDKDVDTADPVTPDTRFRFLGTIFPALALLQLVDAGLVDLEDPLLDYVPEFTLTGSGREDSAALVPGITLRHLLTHTSGMQAGYNNNAPPPVDWPDRSDSVLDEYLTSAEYAGDHHMLAPPGEVVFESALGLALVALVVERVTEAEGNREFFPDYMRDHVFEPLGMTRSTYRVDDVEADGDFAYGFEGLTRWAPTDSDNPWTRPIWGAWSTTRDMARFAQFLLHGDEAVLSQSLLEEALSPQVHAGLIAHGYLGWLSDGPCVTGGICPAEGDLREYFAGGYVLGHAFELIVVPSRDFALIHVANLAGPPFPASRSLAMTELLDLPALEPRAEPGDDHDPDAYVGRYILDSGNTTRVTLEEDGTLHLSSPRCDLRPIAPGLFGCTDATDAFFVFDEAGNVQYLVTSYWVATPDPADAGGGQ